jgi:plastocyanin
MAVVVIIAWLFGLSGARGLEAARPGAEGEPITVTGTAAVVGRGGGVVDSRDVVVWLKPLGATTASAPASRQKLKMIQRNKRFEPGLLVTTVGSTVEFPNLDPFFHNVFSMFDGKRFDLGLYEAGTSRTVTFTTTGVCFVFCNIHPDMSAVIVVVDTPYYAVSNSAGELTIPNVPAGRYALSIWHQRHKADRPADFPRDVTISETANSIGTVRLIESGDVIAPHKNKYGQDYLPPPAASPLYKK